MPISFFFFRKGATAEGNPADAQLYCRPVFDETGKQFTDFVRARTADQRFIFNNRGVYRDQVVDIVHMNHGITQGARHLWIDLGNDFMRVFGGAFDDIDGNTQTAHAVFIGRRRMNQRHIQRQAARFEKFGNVREKIGV